MPFNGSGTFERVHDWTDDRDAGTKIQATRMDQEFDGIATALSNCMTLDGQSTPTANLGMGSFKITSLGTPTASTDAATKGYVDSVATPSPRVVCAAATTANIDLTTSDLENGDTLDGVSLSTGDYVLVKDQTDASENGIYVVVASGAASRAGEFDTWDEHLGAIASVTAGTANADTLWACMASSGGTLNTDDIVWAASGASISLPLAIGSGGTGAALADPGADRIFFFDESAGIGAWLAPGTGLAISGTSLNVSLNYAQLDVENQTLAGGVVVTEKDLGSGTGTMTPDPGDRPLQRIDNDVGAFTLAPSANAGSYVLTVVNGASGAGAITTSGWDSVVGDSFDTGPNNIFRCYATITSDLSQLVVVAGQ